MEDLSSTKEIAFLCEQIDSSQIGLRRNSLQPVDRCKDVLVDHEPIDRNAATDSTCFDTLCSLYFIFSFCFLVAIKQIGLFYHSNIDCQLSSKGRREEMNN